MRVVQINAVSGSGSTGKIAEDISKLLDSHNIENYIFYASGKTQFKNSVKYMSDFEVKFNALKSKVSGNYGFNSKVATKRLIKQIDKIKPDIVHLHNLHGHNIHLGLLFDYLKKSRVKTVWTFHDCWAFTAYCAYFDYIKCNRWQKDCHDCPLYKNASWFKDKSNMVYNLKKAAYENMDNLSVVTPSRWLAHLVEKSFLGKNKVTVINNGIDLSVFKPTESNFKKEHKISDKYMLLGVASPWSPRKGLDDFVKLSKIIDERFSIVLVGVSKEQMNALPPNIIGIERTRDQEELARIYSSADVFLNLTYEDNFPTVNLEALACGTPVITYKTGGSPECIDDSCGIAVDSFDDLYKVVNSLLFTSISSDKCIAKAGNCFNSADRYYDYLKLYRGEI